MRLPPPGTRGRGLLVAALAAVAAYVLVRRDVVSTQSLLFLLVLVPSVVLHEVSHGAVAASFGDDTAKEAGRLTLNPVAHVDPVGTVLLPAILVLVGAAPFGYAKPVPVNPRKMRDPRNHAVVVSLAGPAVNIVLALVAAVALRVSQPDVALFDLSLGVKALIALGVVNVVLATFNLLPIPPLDGSALVERVLPRRWWEPYLRFRQYSMGLLLIVVLLLPRALDRVFQPAISLWARLLG